MPIVFISAALAASGQNIKPDPAIQKIVGEISQDRIADTLKKLTSFETRGDYSDPNQPNRELAQPGAGSTISSKLTARTLKSHSTLTKSRNRARAYNGTSML